MPDPWPPLQTQDDVRVVVIDDHAFVVDALTRVLADEQGVQVVATATTLAAGLRAVDRHQPDLVLLDVALPDGDGAAACADVLAAAPSTRVLVLSGDARTAVVARAVEAGAAGFVTKAHLLDEVVGAILTVAGGGTVFAPGVLQEVAVHLRPGRDQLGADLTDRESQVLQLLADACTVDQIAAGLVLSPHTVRNHVRHVLAKLGARSQLEAVVIALRHGLVTLSDP